jgi:hypothetical protein
MKNILLILFIAAFSLNAASGQKINIQMKMGFLFSKIDYLWDTPVKNEGYAGLPRPTFVFSIDRQLYKGLYLGAEFGTCSHLHYSDFSYKQSYDAPFITTTTYDGTYKQEQIYFTINPSYKFGNNQLFGLGGGFGIYNNTVNTFSSGTVSSKSNDPKSIGLSYKLDGQDYIIPNTTVGGFINAVINPKFNNVGLILEMRYIFNGYSVDPFQTTRVKPDIRFNSLAVLGGLSFHF